MRMPIPRFLAHILLLTAIGCTAWAEPIGFDPATMMRAEEARPGMRGIGKSVFRGVEIEQFEFEIVGRLEKMVLGGDVILCQMVSGPPVERQAGIIGGMSGSPCYIRGRLLGALAYGWHWQKEAMFGIQPIENMLEATYDVHDAPAQAGVDDRWLAGEPLQLGGRTITTAVLGSSSDASPFADAHTIRLYPVAPTLSCSGLGPQAMKLLGDALEPYGIGVMAGPGSKREPVDVTLEPGSAAGVRLMSGDFDMTAVGTVTYVNDGRLLAFGHPLMQLGHTNMPLCTAWIHDVMPSIERSSKFGSGMVDVGTMFSDTPWSIAARMDGPPNTIPATLRMIDRTRGVTKEFHLQVCDQPALTSLVLSSGLVSAAEATFNTSHEGTARVHYKVVGQKGDTIERTNTYFFQGSALSTLSSEIGFPMYLLEENRFRPQNIASLEVTAEFDRRDETAVIERVYAAETVAEAGKPLHLHVVIRPDGGEAVERVVRLDVPIDTPKGALRIAVAGGESAWALRSRLRLMMPAFSNLDAFIGYYEKLEENTDLVVLAALPRVGLTAGDTVLMRLPGALQGLIVNSPRTDLLGGNTELSHSEPSPWVLYGVEYMAIPTADRKGARGAQPTPPSSREAEPNAAVISALPPRAIAPINMLWAADAFPEPIASHLRRAAEDSQIPAPTPPQSGELKLPAEPDADETKTAAENATDTDADSEPIVSSAPAADGKLTARQPRTWTQTTAAEFLEGDPDGVAIRSDGVVTLAPHVEKLDTPGEFYALSSATDDTGNVYIGTGAEGRIYRVDSDAQVTLFADLNCFAVTGLLWDADSSDLLATTSPGGHIYRVSPDGTVSLYAELPAEYIWTIGYSPQGKLLIGSGPDGVLYELDASGSFTQICALGQAHIMCMAADDKHTYLGTASQGVLYRLNEDCTYTAIFDAKDKDITAVAISEVTGGTPTVYISTASESSGGGVYQISESGQAVTMYEENSVSVYSLAWLGDALYAGTGSEGKLLRIADRKRHSVAYKSDNAPVTCLQPTDGYQLIAGTSNLLSILKLDTERPTQGTLESSVLDAERAAQWGRIHMEAQVTGQGSIRLSTRSGGSSDPADRSWSPWAPALTQPGSDMVQSPANRYLQYRLELARPGADDGIELSRVSVAYMPANRDPQVSITKPAEGDVISGSYTLTWDATDPDDDTLINSIQCQQIGHSDWQTVLAGTDDKTHEWDTTAVASGRYRLQIEASDRASNPTHPLSTAATVELVTIDNETPKVWVDTVETRDGVLYISGVAADGISRVAEVCYSTDDRWYAARATDGMYDSQYERFDFAIPLPKRTTTITIRAQDAANNEAEVTVTWPDRKKTGPDTQE